MIWMELDFINILVFFVSNLSLPVWIAFSMIYVFWVFIIFNNTILHISIISQYSHRWLVLKLAKPKFLYIGGSGGIMAITI